MGILVYSDDPDVTLELVTLGHEAWQGRIRRNHRTSKYLRPNKESLQFQESQISYEVSNDALKDLLSAPLWMHLRLVYSQAKPDLILIGSTKRGKEVAPRLATRLKIGCISDALKIELDGGNAIAERLVWGGNSIATVASKGVAVVTIPPRAMDEPPVHHLRASSKLNSSQNRTGLFS